MKRLTKEIDKNTYVMDASHIHCTQETCSGIAVDRLGKFENLYDYLVLYQKEISEKMDHLKKEDKTKTVAFKTLMGKKLMNDSYLNLMHIYGIE